MATEAIVQFSKTYSNLIVIPTTPVDAEFLEDIPLGRDAKLVVTVPRGLPFHKKFFALLKTILNYMDDRTKLALNVHTVPELLIRIKLDLGLYTLHIAGAGGAVPEGQPIYIPDSISFGRMDETKFSRLYKDTINVAVGKYVPTQNPASMMAAVDALLRFE